MTPASGDDEQQASQGERNACDDRSGNRDLEGWDLGSDEPDTGKQDQQESGLGEGDASLTTHLGAIVAVPALLLEAPRT